MESKYEPPVNYCKEYKERGEASFRKFLEENRAFLNVNRYYPMPPGFVLSLPLMSVIDGNCPEAAELMVEYGANPFLKCNCREITPYAYSVLQKKRTIQELFFNQRPKHPEWEQKAAEFIHYLPYTL